MSRDYNHENSNHNREIAIGITLDIVFVVLVIEVVFDLLAESFVLIADVGQSLI